MLGWFVAIVWPEFHDHVDVHFRFIYNDAALFTLFHPSAIRNEALQFQTVEKQLALFLANRI